MRITIPLITILLFTSGCREEAALVDFGAQLDQLEEDLNRLSAEIDAENSFDSNGDQIPDSIFALTHDGSIQELDTNFDGQIDERLIYNEDSLLISAAEDANLDGIYETIHIAEHGYIVKSFADTDQNGVVDMYTEYSDVGAVFSERFILGKDRIQAEIGRVEYDDFAYPVSSEVRERTSMTEQEFEDKYWFEVDT